MINQRPRDKDRFVFESIEQARNRTGYAWTCHSDRQMYADGLDLLPGRHTGEASDIGQRLPLGYFTSYVHQDETVRGFVLQLPSSKGEHRYYPAVYWTDCDGVTGWPLDWYETPEEAACAADHKAQVVAEDDCEYDQIQRAEMKREDNRQEMADHRQQVRALAGDLRKLRKDRQSLPTAVCDTLRDSIADAVSSVHQLAAECALLRDEPSRIDG